MEATSSLLTSYLEKFFSIQEKVYFMKNTTGRKRMSQYRVSTCDAFYFAMHMNRQPGRY